LAGIGDGRRGVLAEREGEAEFSASGTPSTPKPMPVVAKARDALGVTSSKA